MYKTKPDTEEKVLKRLENLEGLFQRMVKKLEKDSEWAESLVREMNQMKKETDKEMNQMKKEIQQIKNFLKKMKVTEHEIENDNALRSSVEAHISKNIPEQHAMSHINLVTQMNGMQIF